MTSDFAVRAAVPDDGPELAALDARSWPPELVVVAPRPAEEPFFDERRRPEDVFVADDGTRLGGYVKIGPHIPIESNAHVLHVHALVVVPEARGAGLGSALVQVAIEQARARGVRKLGLRALSNNPTALRLYERFGFVEEGRLRGELLRPDGSYADDVWLALAIDLT